MLLLRLVADVEVDPEGRVRPRPGAAWRLEPARGETAIHRRLASLATAPEAKIAAFASRYGLLRHHAPGVLEAPGPDSRAATAVAGHEALDELAEVDAWIDAGMLGPPPAGTQDTLLTLMIYAQLPNAIYEQIESVMSGPARDDPVRQSDFYAAAMPSILAASRVRAALAGQPIPTDHVEPQRLRRAARNLRVGEPSHRRTG